MKQNSFEHIETELQKQLKADRIIINAPMSKYTSFKAGGNARVLVLPKNSSELKWALNCADAEKMPRLIMGNGSNILVRDGGYNGMVIKMGEEFSGVEFEGNCITAGAGTLMSVIAKEALNAGLTGFEFAGGIPGSIGGALFMNAGAYEGEMSHIVKSARVMSLDGEREYEIQKAHMQLGYRCSAFQENKAIILSVTLELQPGDREEIAAKMKDLTQRRNEKQPVNLPSAGSFFKRPEGYFAGKLIQDAGLKGLSVGGAQVSPLHSGFIVNNGNASATDILNLMGLVQNAVYDKYQVRLEPEVRIIGED